MTKLVQVERKKLKVSEFVLDERCQASRVTLNADAVQDYAAVYRAKKEMPPPEVFWVEGTGYVVIDGFHRVGGMRIAGLSWHWAIVVGSGTIEEAGWAALKRNHDHGIQRTPDDKRHAVEFALNHPNSRNLSARALAEHCGVSDDLVGDVKKKREASGGGAGPERVTGKDGKSYPVSKRPSARATPEQSRGQLSIAETATEKETRREVQAAADAAVKSSTSSSKPNGSAVASDQPVVAAVELLRTTRLAIQKLGRESPHVHTLLEQAAKQIAGIEDGLEAERPTKCPACDGAGCEKCTRRGWVGRRVAELMKGGSRG